MGLLEPTSQTLALARTNKLRGGAVMSLFPPRRTLKNALQSYSPRRFRDEILGVLNQKTMKTYLIAFLISSIGTAPQSSRFVMFIDVIVELNQQRAASWQIAGRPMKNSRLTTSEGRRRRQRPLCAPHMVLPLPFIFSKTQVSEKKIFSTFNRPVYSIPLAGMSFESDQNWATRSTVSGCIPSYVSMSG